MSFTAHQELTERSPVASFVYNLSTLTLIYGNPAFFSLLNIDKHGLTPGFLKEIIHQEDLEYAHKALLDLRNGTLKDHVQLRISVGSDVKWIRIMASVSENAEHETLIYGNAIDVTAELENQSVFEKYANKKNAILNILAHDLTGPLSTINMLSSSLRSSNRDAGEMRQIDTIIKINKQATSIIRELTEREFLETSEIVLSKKRVNISRKLKEYVEEYQRSAAEIKRTFHFSTAPNDIFLAIDEGKFFQIMNNLGTNALKFTAVDGNVWVSVEDRGEHVRFSVKDDGIGIPKEHHAILFDKFTDARRKGLQGEPTMGLGMYVVKNIIEWHNGKVWIDGAQDKGTTVCFELPKQ